MGGTHMARMGRGEVYIFGGKAGGKELLGRPRYRWEDNIKMYFQEVWCGGTDWIALAQDRDSGERW